MREAGARPREGRPDRGARASRTVMYLRILVPSDGSACSDEAVAHAVAIAKAMGSAVVFLFVMDTLRAWREGVVNGAEALQALTDQGRVVLDRAQEAAFDAGVGARGELVEGTAADVIVRRSSDFDLVVMGSHGKGILERLTVGSVTAAVLHRITGPLLIVRRGHPAQAPG
jgi:nucleotide-binding universal stress UspA family protein